MEKDIVILGPTGIGKTQIAVEVAKNVNAEIISSDSMQIYKYMGIGTNYPSEEEQSEVSHHLINFLHPKDNFDVFQYINKSKKIIKSLHDLKKRVVVTGGTGLYIRGLLQGIVEEKKSDKLERVRLEKIVEERGIEPLRTELAKFDPDKYHALPKNDFRRIIRALAYFNVNKIPLSQVQDNWASESNKKFILIGLTMDRQALYEKINRRVDSMMDRGLLEEVKNLVRIGVSESCTCWQAIGYKQLKMYLDNKCSLNESIELIKRDSRRYAKRQWTWFSKMNNIHWFDRTNPDLIEEVLKTVNQK